MLPDEAFRGLAEAQGLPAAAFHHAGMGPVQGGGDDLSRQGVDGLEVCNSGNNPEWDQLALRYARKMMSNRFFSSGSDIHHTEDRDDNHIFGIGFDRPLRDVYDFARLVRQNAPHTLQFSSDRGIPWKGDPREGLGMPMTILGQDGTDSGLSTEDIF